MGLITLSLYKNFEGKLPDNLEDLLTLPGIGNYTANAILAIAFNKPYIPLDGNIERVLKRYLYLKKDKEIQKDYLLQKKSVFGKTLRSSDYAQALMEIGALICKPKNPICDQCPIIKNCRSYKKKDFNLTKNLTIGISSERGNTTSLRFSYKNYPKKSKPRYAYKESQHKESDSKYKKFIRNLKIIRDVS